MNLQSLLANKHTSGAALVWILASIITRLGPIWFPTHTGQFQDTADAIKEIAVAYGLLAAGDASKSKADADAIQKQVSANAADIQTKDGK